jgi:hypothetical protein
VVLHRKKSTLVNEKVNAWSTEKSTPGQRKVNGQRWSKSTVNARADVASWRRDTWQRRRLARGGAGGRVTAHRIFRRRVRARPTSESAVFCAVESIISRAFQRYRRCLDRSPGTADPRVAVGPFRR